MQTPAVPPVGWEATLAPGASPVVIEAFAPGAITSGEIAILGVLLFGFGLMVVLLLLLLLKRTH